MNNKEKEINENEKIIGIYKITNPMGLVYIGQSINIIKRWKSYTNKCLNIKRQPKIFNSLVTYNNINHKFDIICECEIDELDQLEALYKKFYINKLGGWEMVLFCCIHDGRRGPLSLETRKKMSEASKGKKKGELYSNKISEIKSKPVEQYDLKGNFINYHSSARSAGKNLGKSSGISISYCCNKKKKYKTAYGFLWKWSNDPLDFSYSFELNEKSIPVKQIDIYGNTIKEWGSAAKASKELGIDHGSIINCCKEKKRTAKGLMFKYK